MTTATPRFRCGLLIGGPYDPMLIGTPYGRSRKDVAGYILQGTVNVLLGATPDPVLSGASKPILL